MFINNETHLKTVYYFKENSILLGTDGLKSKILIYLELPLMEEGGFSRKT